NREDGGELDQRDEAEARHLTRHLSDTNGPTQLVRRLAASDHAADITERALNDRPSLPDRKHDRLRRRHRMKLEVFRRHRAADAEDTDALHVAEIILYLFQRRLGVEDELVAPAIDRNGECLTGA